MSPEPEDSTSGSFKWAPYVARLLVLAAILLLARVAAMAMILVATVKLERHELVGEVAGQVAQVLGLSLLCAAGVCALHELRRGRVLALCVAWLAFAVLLTGWPWAPLNMRALPDSLRGHVAFWGLAGTALALVALLPTLQRRLDRSRLASVIPALCILASALFWTTTDVARGFGVPVQVRERVLDLVPLESSWQVIEARKNAAPYAGILTPIADSKHGGGDMPSLILPPPCEVSMVIPADLGDLGELQLTGAVGTDRGIALKLRGEESLEVRFRAWLDDELVLDEKIVYHEGDTSKKVGWRYLGAGAGLRVRAGGTLRLRTDSVLDSQRKNVQRQVIAAGFGGLSLEQLTEVPSAPATPQTPNIILIVMDTLRADRCSTYGYGRETTPHLSRLAARGTLFEQAHSASSWTWPSTASILTGLGVEEHGVRNGTACFLAHENATLAETLARRGYHTGGFSGNPLISSLRNFNQGFETFHDSGSSFQHSKEVVPKLLAYIRRHRGEKFFLYAQLVDPHDPPNPLRRYRDRFDAKCPEGVDPRTLNKLNFSLLRSAGNDGGESPIIAASAVERAWIDNAYDACVATGDHWLGQVLDLLEELGLEENTIVAFTSDHGEELFDHGFVKHGHSLHTELVRVPLVIAGPGIPAGKSIAMRVANRHLAPTLARFGGSPIPGLTDPLDLLLDGGREERSIFFTTHQGWIDGENKQQILGLRADGWSMHFRPAVEDGRERLLGLYDLDADPLEQRDLSARHKERAQGMMKAALAEARGQALRSPRVQAGGAGTDELLRMLGYAGEEEEEEEDEEQPGADKKMRRATEQDK